MSYKTVFTQFYSIALLLNYYICVVGLCMARRMSTHKERQARASVKPEKIMEWVTAVKVKAFSKEFVVFEATTMYIENYVRRAKDRRGVVCEGEPESTSDWYAI